MKNTMQMYELMLNLPNCFLKNIVCYTKWPRNMLYNILGEVASSDNAERHTLVWLMEESPLRDVLHGGLQGLYSIRAVDRAYVTVLMKSE